MNYTSVFHAKHTKSPDPLAPCDKIKATFKIFAAAFFEPILCGAQKGVDPREANHLSMHHGEASGEEAGADVQSNHAPLNSRRHGGPICMEMKRAFRSKQVIRTRKGSAWNGIQYEPLATMFRNREAQM